MKKNNRFVMFVLCAWILALGAYGLDATMQTHVAFAQGPAPKAPRINSPKANAGTAFTYQGQLKNGGTGVNGSCDMQFSLWDAASIGTQIGTTQTQTNVSVSNGLFTTQIDFGTGAITGDARWLGIAVRCPSGSGGYTSLTPRQALTPAPIALSLPGLYTKQSATSPNVIGGYSGNIISDTVAGGTISGGGLVGYENRVGNDYATIGGGYKNTASGIASTISGGYNNKASNPDATIGGGLDNSATNDYTTIGGGRQNNASGQYATISGGYSNTVSANYTSVGGGENNTATYLHAAIAGGKNNVASGPFSSVGGGLHNIATGSVYGANISGGISNQAINEAAAVGGGWNNTASGQYATVPGGSENTAAGMYSFAAGNQAQANHQGSFVWGDSTNAPIASTTTNQFLVRATNGVSLTANAGSAKSIAVGERYRDNALIAWGDISSTGTWAGQSFGISSITKSTGIYTITLSSQPSNSFNIVPVAIAEMDAPPTGAASARLVTINIISANQFVVYITDGTYALTDHQFLFMATGR